ncbi:MAG: VanZ family protein [Polyangiales bacterium]
MTQASSKPQPFRFRRVFPAILFAAFCVLVTWDADQGGSWFGQINAIPHGDKLGHFSLMAIAAFLSNIALRGRAWRGLLIGSIAVFVLITLEEVRQHFVPNRSFSVGDLVANTLGITLADLVYRYVRRVRRRHSMTESRDSRGVSE